MCGSLFTVVYLGRISEVSSAIEEPGQSKYVNNLPQSVVFGKPAQKLYHA